MSTGQVTGVGFPLDFGTIDTEIAVVAFQISTGVFGGISALVAARRLSRLETDTIPTTSLFLPIAIAGVSTVIGAYLLPSA